jgi:DNA modification methylase
VWSDIAGGRSAEGRHNAAFPIELPRRHILLYSARGEIVVDPMVGSGTTMAAAEQLGRIGYGIEIDPRFASVTLERMAEMGLEPVRVERLQARRAN